ncbi:hypothetical protein JKF63_01453 [Porcisia hertigi]|uniref:FPL domain-containing protein n=1 Tax=Porcisia hertigi TaxID=2761500 RepID=A0A836I3Q6_9TRYP|nr:hypothetical protein JKF63_01453 [Porcisia hertigi]
MEKLKEAFTRVDKFSLENANQLCKEVECIEETLLRDGCDAEHKAKLIITSLQRIRELTEVLIWMDSNHDEWFERVMERAVMNTLERLVTNGLMPSSIKLQSLQSVTIMLQNLSRASSLYYVCSNNHINRMVAVEFDIHDDEFVSLYVSFLKSLALRCTPDTVQFFFDAQDDAFPLWDRALRLLSSEDAMVRTAAKQIIVTIAQLPDVAMSAFVAASIADVFRSVLCCVDAQIVRLAASVPSWNTSQRTGIFAGVDSDPSVATAAFFTAPAAAPPWPSGPNPILANSLGFRVQLEDLEDELLYINDLCRTPVSNAGAHAAAVLQRVLIPRFRSIIEAEVDNAGSAPASVILAFLFFWSQVNTDPCVTAALVSFLLEPIHSSSRTSPFTVASMVLESTRVDLHEPVVAICRHALSRTKTQPASSPLPQASLRLPTSLGQFFYAETPYQQTGRVLVGGPSTMIPPPKEKFLERVFTSPPAATPDVFVSLIPHLVAALYTQLKYYHVTRLNCVITSLSLLLELIPKAAAGTPSLPRLYFELMKLVQHLLLACAKRYAAVIQEGVQAQKVAEDVVPLSQISFSYLDSVEEEPPLAIRDPYTPMFLKLKEAVRWMETAKQERSPLLETAVHGHSKRDLYLFSPAFPLLVTDECSLAYSAWPPLLSVSGQQSRDAEQWAAAYRVVRDSVASTFDYSTRSPVSDAECELNLYIIFLLIRRAFAHCAYGNGGELLHLTLQQLNPRHTPSTYFGMTDATVTLSVRCEISSEWHPDSQVPPIAPLGTAVCVVLPSDASGTGGKELLFLDTPRNVPERVNSQELHTGTYMRLILRSLDLAFVGIAVHSQYPFKVVLSYHLPGHVMLLHLVTTGAAMAQMMVTEVEKATNECHQRGASFCFGLMNYRSALLDE